MATEAQFRNCRYFQRGEFKNPALIDVAALMWLDDIRHAYGHPLSITGDARLAGDVPSGGSLTSLHYLGRAFDLRYPETPELAYVLNASIVAVSTSHVIELEWVHGAGDAHVHLGLYPTDTVHRQSRLLVRAD